MQEFPAEVVNELQNYVYRLIDPRNGETFYIGRGVGNRVFQHARAELSQADEGDAMSEKLERIREIRMSNFEVAHVIHRHGMDQNTAIEVEAALIDAYPGLTNIQGGAHSGDYGVAHAQQIVERYAAEEAKLVHRVLMININQTAAEHDVYEAVRFAWKINPEKAERAELTLAVHQGLIVGVFVADRWLPATTENFPGREAVPGRFGFVGSEAPTNLAELYRRKRVPDEFRKHGSANPIRYNYD